MEEPQRCLRGGLGRDGTLGLLIVGTESSRDHPYDDRQGLGSSVGIMIIHNLNRHFDAELGAGGKLKRVVRSGAFSGGSGTKTAATPDCKSG